MAGKKNFFPNSARAAAVCVVYHLSPKAVRFESGESILAVSADKVRNFMQSMTYGIKESDGIKESEIMELRHAAAASTRAPLSPSLPGGEGPGVRGPSLHAALRHADYQLAPNAVQFESGESILNVSTDQALTIQCKSLSDNRLP